MTLFFGLILSMNVVGFSASAQENPLEVLEKVVGPEYFQLQEKAIECQHSMEWIWNSGDANPKTVSDLKLAPKPKQLKVDGVNLDSLLQEHTDIVCRSTNAALAKLDNMEPEKMSSYIKKNAKTVKQGMLCVVKAEVEFLRKFARDTNSMKAVRIAKSCQ